MTSSRKKVNISCIKPDEPAFLKRIKEQVGFKPAATIDSKRLPCLGSACNPDDDDKNECDRDDEKPQVVVLKSGDLSEAEIKATEIAQGIEDDERKIREGKITFKPPSKRKADEPASLCTTTKRPTASERSVDADDRLLGTGKQAEKQSRLLSFQDDGDND